MSHIENILNNLQLYRGNLHKGDWSAVFNEKRLSDTIDPAFSLYAVFSFEGKPLILFFDNPTKLIEPKLHKWIWNLNESAVAVVVTGNTVDVFNAFDMNAEHKLLRKIGGEEILLQRFSYLKIVTGETWSEWRDKFLASNRVDSRLLRDLECVRQITVQQLQSKGAKEQAYRIANAWIGRLLFIRYLIDRKVKIHFGDYADKWLSSDDLNQILESPKTTFALFEHLKGQFNGDLFPFIKLSEDDEPSIKEQDVMDVDMLQNFVKLFRGDEMNGQLSLFPLYDFAVIPIEFVSNVYEHFIGTDEAEKKGNKEKDKQREQGAYYTPKFLVDYVLEKTVGEHLNDDPSVSTCRVLDPACGSGIFLVETLRRLILRYQSLHPDFEQDTAQYKAALRQLVWDNIFGIDIDNNAIDVAIFSLYITLLDYQSSADIEHFKLPPLRDRNFFVADTFETELPFNKILAQKIDESPFDFIIGNPPWGKTSGKQIYSEYCKQREKREKKTINASNKEAAQAFLIRVSDFSTAGHTRTALIVTSKVLYNLQAANFRGYFLRHFFLDEILELSPVRHQVFDKTTSTGSKSKAIAPASVLFYRWADGVDTSKNLVEHNTLKPNIFFRLFKRLVFEKHDRKTVSQEQFIVYDWLFKLLVYGNVLDFNFMKRLLKYSSIGDEISRRKDDFLEPKQGLKRHDRYKKEKINSSHIVGLDFLDTQKKELRQFFILPDHKPWQLQEVSQLPSIEIFYPPTLLITEGLTNRLRSNSAVSYNTVVFTSSIKAIKAKNNEGIPFLQTFAGLLNSSLFAYYILMKGSSAAVEREQAHDEETFGFPFVESSRLADLVGQMEKTKQDAFNASDLPQSRNLHIEAEEQQLVNAIDALVVEIFNLSEEEKSLLRYAEDILISIFKDKENSPAYHKIPAQDPILNDYAQVFLNYFKPRFTDHLGAEVYQSDYCIAVRIYRSEQLVATPIVFKSNQSFEEIVNLFFAQSFERLTEDLFIQKDVRGFDQKSFYIIKPNERKCWHKAVAYLDAYEFGETIESL